ICTIKQLQQVTVAADDDEIIIFLWKGADDIVRFITFDSSLAESDVINDFFYIVKLGYQLLGRRSPVLLIIFEPFIAYCLGPHIPCDDHPCGFQYFHKLECLYYHALDTVRRNPRFVDHELVAETGRKEMPEQQSHSVYDQRSVIIHVFCPSFHSAGYLPS